MCNAFSVFNENFDDIALAIADGILETLEEVARESAVNQTETGQEMLSSESGESRQNGAYFENSENKQNETYFEDRNKAYVEYSEDNVSDKIAGAAENPGVLQDMRQDQRVELSGNTATLMSVGFSLKEEKTSSSLFVNVKMRIPSSIFVLITFAI